MPNEEIRANEMPMDEEMQFLDPEGPSQPDRSSLLWEQVIAFGLAPLVVGAAVFWIHGSFFVGGCEGATRSASLEQERRQELIEQARLEHDNRDVDEPQHNE